MQSIRSAVAQATTQHALGIGGLPTTLALTGTELAVWAEDFSACPDLPYSLNMGAPEPCCSSCKY